MLYLMGRVLLSEPKRLSNRISLDLVLKSVIASRNFSRTSVLSVSPSLLSLSLLPVPVGLLPVWLPGYQLPPPSEKADETIAITSF